MHKELRVLCRFHLRNLGRNPAEGILAIAASIGFVAVFAIAMLIPEVDRLDVSDRVFIPLLLIFVIGHKSGSVILDDQAFTMLLKERGQFFSWYMVLLLVNGLVAATLLFPGCFAGLIHTRDYLWVIVYASLCLLAVFNMHISYLMALIAIPLESVAVRNLIHIITYVPIALAGFAAYFITCLWSKNLVSALCIVSAILLCILWPLSRMTRMKARSITRCLEYPQ